MTLREIKSIIALATPLIIGQLGQMLLGVFDTIMVGKLGVLELASLSFANSLFIIPFVFAIGILTSIAIRTSTARGKQNHQDARSVCLNGFYFSAIIGILFFLLALAAFPFLHSMGQEPAVATRAENYYLIVMASLIPCSISLMLKNHADALDRAWPAFWIFMAGVAINILLNAALIYGKWGFPTLGLEGAGIATLVARWLIVISMLCWFHYDKRLKPWTPTRWLTAPHWSEIKALTKLGLPAGFQTLAEVSTFAVAGLMIGVFGAAPLAAHQVALQASGMAFMIPLGLSMALTVRISEVADDTQRQRDIVKTGWMLTSISSCSTAALFMLAGSWVSSLFISDAQIIATASSLLFISGVFQIVDGFQVSSTGLLRGLHDTEIPAKLAIFSYWIIGIPSGYLLAHAAHLAEQGIWWGLAIGLGIAAILLSTRLWKKLL